MGISKIVLFVLITLLAFSCSEKVNYEVKKEGGITTFKNKNSPNDPNFNLTFTQVDSIPFTGPEDLEDRSFTEPRAICSDSKGNIYIADYPSTRVYKFSKSFKFIKSFGGKGSGPGEMYGGPATLSYSDNRILVSDLNNEDVYVYTTDGKHLKKMPQNISCSFSHGQDGFNDKTIMNVVSRAFDGDIQTIISTIFLIDPTLSETSKEIFTHTARADNGVIPMSDMHVRFTAGKEKLYIGSVSKDFYSVEVFDNNLNHIETISKNYRSVVNQDSNAIVYQFSPGSLGGGIPPKSRSNWRNRKLYHNAISFLMSDKNDRLWVVAADNNSKKKSGLYVDIFDKGVYLNSVHLPFYKGEGFSGTFGTVFLENDKLFYIDYRSKCIRVFDY